MKHQMDQQNGELLFVDICREEFLRCFITDLYLGVFPTCIHLLLLQSTLFSILFLFDVALHICSLRAFSCPLHDELYFIK